MLSPAAVNAFIRDERAWQRAAKQPLCDCALSSSKIGSKEGNWLVFRSGSSDNTSSLRFANTLRISGSTNNVDTFAVSHTHSTLSHPRWNSSARSESDNAYTDHLHQLLVRNLHRKGTPALLSKRRESQLARVPRIRPGARHACCGSGIEHQVQQLTSLERYDRHRLVTLARNRFNAIASSFFGAAARELLACELGRRKTLFREWQEAYRDMESSMNRELSVRTGMTPQDFKAVCRVIGTEAIMRRRVQVLERQSRELYTRIIYLHQMKTLGKELDERRRATL
ncbi:hypothetical protein JKF63_05875 [Porcisia hertigi]|uniref:Uncharacterized protein n=1 Tax=Porcisia hertigi TaxID=2761500 RepID=A0A836IIP0_9TRYP|nr:hypothetical protein JKF63_05875 [Porcisia hertigi]